MALTINISKELGDSQEILNEFIEDYLSAEPYEEGDPQLSMLDGEFDQRRLASSAKRFLLDIGYNINELEKRRRPMSQV